MGAGDGVAVGAAGRYPGPEGAAPRPSSGSGPRAGCPTGVAALASGADAAGSGAQAIVGPAIAASRACVVVATGRASQEDLAAPDSSAQPTNPKQASASIRLVTPVRIPKPSLPVRPTRRRYNRLAAGREKTRSPGLLCRPAAGQVSEPPP